MVDVLIDWQPWETMFAGEPVRMKLRPLKRYAMALLTPHMAKFPGSKEEMEAMDRFEMADNAYQLQELAARIFPDHVKDIENLTVGGKPVEVGMLAEESVFVNLATEVISQLSIISVVTQGDAKNSQPPSHTDTQDGTTKPVLKVSQLPSG
jgi:hypothetical protein